MSNLSSLITAPLLIEPKISRGLLRALLASHILAIVPVVQSGLSNGQKFIIGIVLLSSYCWQRYRLHHRRLGIRYHQQRWSLYQPGEKLSTGHEVSLADQAVVTRWFIVLYFYLPESRWRRTPVLIAADAVPRETFRHLRILLKWGL